MWQKAVGNGRQPSSWQAPLLPKPSTNILVEGSRVLRQLLSGVDRTGFLSTINSQPDTCDVVLFDAVRSPCAGAPGLFDIYG